MAMPCSRRTWRVSAAIAGNVVPGSIRPVGPGAASLARRAPSRPPGGGRALLAALRRLLPAFLLAAGAANPALAVRVADDTGAAIELSAPATRIVTLAPHAAELVAAAGAASRLV